MFVSNVANATSPDQTQVAKKHERRATTLLEYVMVVSLIITVCLVGIGFFGSENNKLTDATGAAINKSLNKGSSSGGNQGNPGGNGNGKGKGNGK